MTRFTIVDALRRQAERLPDGIVYRFLEDGEREGDSVTFGELERRALATAAALLAAGGRRGDRALLLYPPGLDFITAFLGCLHAGVVAVPAYPPRSDRADPRLQSIAADSTPRFALTTVALRTRAALLAEGSPALAALTWLASEEIEGIGSGGDAPTAGGAPATADDIAFLQYTSGSTAAPKGVVVRHGNLIHNERMIQAAFGQSESSVVVGWLPLYHDMGLIGNVLQPLYSGAACVLMSPVAFLRRPYRWLAAISRYRATTSGGPNFAYDLCAARIRPAERDELDLSSWTVAYNGAEPVRAETLERFAAAFEPCGFRRSAFLPCYGLAEATLFVAGAAAGSEPGVLTVDAAALERHRAAPPREGEAVRLLVSCGRTGPGETVEVVDPESLEPCADGEVGEVWVAGPSVTGGYWGRREETAAAFGARLSSGAGPFLRTGDLGFLHGRELYLTGRIKDLIILRGRNLYPQDVELVAERSYPGLRPGCGAAFSVEAGGEERLVVAQEVEREIERAWAKAPDGGAAARAEALEAVRRAIGQELEAAPLAVLLVTAGTVPKTSSGKLQRRALRASFLAGGLAPLAAWREGEEGSGVAGDIEAPAGSATRTPTEERLARIVAEILGARALGADDDLLALGADSLRSIQILARVREELGREVTLEQLFAAPTLGGLAALVDGGPAGAEPAPPAPIARCPRGAAIPLSFAQRRLWFLHQLDPENPVHNLGAALRLSGRLDVPLLAAALAEIARRHEALRTRFDASGSEPMQIVSPPGPLPLPVVDLSLLPAAAREGERGRAARQLGRAPFALERGEVLRLALIRLGAGAEGGEHELQLGMHHVAFDGGSLAVFTTELAALYSARSGPAAGSAISESRASPLPDLPIQGADFAAWQRRSLDEAALAPGLAYWRRQLGGDLPATELPADRPRPPLLSHRGAHFESRLPPALMARLGALARAERSTLVLLLLTAFAELLHRSTGQDELVIGTPVSGRERREVEPLIGVFLNNLVLRLRRAEAGVEPTFRSLLAATRPVLLGALAHAEVPFERLVDELRPARDLSRTPLFQILFVGQNAPLRGAELPGLRLRPREVDLGVARFDLALSLGEVDDGWLGTWKHATDLFDRTTIARLSAHLESLLAAAAAAPGDPLSSLSLLSLAERHQVVAAWNDTAALYPAGGGLHERIAAQAARTPDVIALEEGEARLTYAELLSRAAALAARLRGLGVGPESRVGIAAERSVEMVVGLLGTLAAGAAYVPLDPDYPAERLAYMLTDSRVEVLLAQAHLLGRFSPGAGESALDLTALASPGAAGVPPARLAAVDPESPAYAIYTSGSTGRPKGAVVPHGGIVNRLLWMQEAYGLDASDRVLQKTPYSFDVSVWELFWPLLTGARLVMAPPGVHQDPARLADLIRGRGVTTLHFVPSMLQVFLDQPGLEGACRAVRRVFTSGEALPFDLKERFLERLPGVELHNLYGPTEASVDVTYHPASPGGRRHAVPIGRPVANTAIVLLDRAGAPVPIGVPGELHIGGVNLARGYLGRPDLTAERFVPDGTTGAAGARLYRTGDLARFRPDGEVEFLGRLDYQVKIRGVRIELGEIEAALADRPGVREAVVVARREPEGAARLVAYWVPAGGAAEPTAAELRDALRRHLPEAMIPAAFVRLEALPLTASGKADRKALPAPATAEREARGGGAPFESPATPLERFVAGLWSAQLGLPEVGRNDSFFALGGDSIQGAMFINRLQRELGEIVYVMALFDAPTLSAFAAYLESGYPRAAARLAPHGAPAEPSAASQAEPRPLDAALDVEAGLAALRAAVARRLGRSADGPAAPPRPEPKAQRGGGRKGPVFLLSPFRSGSTLLRVMLAGHPGLFAPPELELLGFAGMGERRAAYSGRESFAREGLVRAVMELDACAAPIAEGIVKVWEDEDLGTASVYDRLAEMAAGRILVDKTPGYALDPQALRRAESLFDRPLYVHLVRHPRATIDSYVEARMDQVYGTFPFPAVEQAELVWLLAQRNLLDFFLGIPAERQHRLRFEDLVSEPRRAMEELAAFLGLEFESAMLDPYSGRRMTDGVRAGTRMMGDPKFHQHQEVDSRVAERWKAGGALAAATRALGAALGYADLELEPERHRVESAAAPATALRPVPRGGALPLSFAQERLWFLAQLDPESPAYNMPGAVRMSGHLDVPALAASFAEVRRRHEVLRTTFASTAGRPMQRVAPPEAAAPSTLATVDLSALGSEARERERHRLALEEGRRPFDLETGPMLRTTLLRLGGEEQLLLLTLHHVVSDGWTVGVLVRELGVLYAAFRARRPSPLPELTLQYADYAAWQRRWLDEAAMAAHLDYWRRRLAGPLPPLELPTDRPRPAVQTLRGARLSRTLPSAETEKVRAWSVGEGGTFFLTLLAAFNALLHRTTGQEDLLLGVPIANRNRLETEGMLGVFLNMVVQRTDAAGEPRFAELLGRVRDGFVGSIPHQEVPFERLVEELAPERDLSRAPIFQVQFSLQNTPSEPLALPGLTLELVEEHNRTTKFDLTVFLFDLHGGLATTLEYNADLFDEATIDRLLDRWLRLLTGSVAAPTARLADLPFFSQAERATLLTGWNDPRAVFPAETTIHRLFEARAAAGPDAVAAVHEVEEISYRELDARSNRLARRLRSLGVGPEVGVGLCVERSLDMVVAILGILKAGGAYVPLDPAYPAERLSWILEDALRGSDAPVLVTQSHLEGRFAAGDGAAAPAFRTVRLDADRGAITAESAEPLPDSPGSSSRSLAYVIYTSGSTGRPKGVPIAHENVVRLFRATEPWFAFGPEDVWTVFHSFAFDFSVWEIWGALLYGGRLVIVPREASLSPPAFYELLATEGVTMLSQTPSVFRQVVQAEIEEGARRLALRAVVFGGEALDFGALAPWITRHGDATPALVNMYGITETTVHVTYRPVRAADLERPSISPIGAPIPDQRVYLLGARGELLPVGIPGEIHVGGAGLARGYLNRPELTAERFIPDPFSLFPGGRLYRSGDLARRRPSGEIDYLGRIDSQVKIRGFRIELGEIEAALHRHPRVREALVLTRPGSTAGLRLVAWVVPDGGPIDGAALREHLSRDLPDYMVPSAIVTLDRLPLTAHGKVDRRALPAPEEAAAAAKGAKTPPGTETERRLAAVWREVLRLPEEVELGVDDNFFELGGHSLLATQVVSRMNASFGAGLPLRALFEAPTLSGLAATLCAAGVGSEAAGGEAAEDAASASPAPPLRPRPRPAAIPLSFAQERLWFMEQLDPEGSVYSMPIALRLGGPLLPEALRAALREIVRRHEALRTTFAAVDGRPVQAIDEAWRPELPLIDLNGLDGAARSAELGRLLRANEAEPFDLRRGPLVRAKLVRLVAGAAGEHALLFNMHHIVSDGWSLGVLLRELVALYAAYPWEAGALPELPLQFADFALWQREWLRGEVVERQLAYWTGQLAGAAPLALPADRAAQGGVSFRAGDEAIEIEEHRTVALRSLARRHGASLYMVLLALYQTLLHRHAGQDDVSVGSPIANRERVETEGLIGFFVNTLVLRTSFAGEPTFTALLARVRETTLGAFEHQDLPFARVVEALRPDRRHGSWPLIDAMFVLQNQPMPAMGLDGVTMELIRHDGGALGISFALALRFWESGDRLSGGLGFNLARFEPATARRFRDRFVRLLEAVLADPGRRLADLPMLTPGEEIEVARRLEGAAVSAPGSAPGAGPKSAAGVAEAVAQQRSALAGRLDTLPAAKRELLERRLRGAGRGGGSGAVERGAARRTSSSGLLVRLREGSPERPPFFCVHAVGGTLFAYAELARSLAEGQAFYGIQAPGVEGDATAPAGPETATLESLARLYAAEVEKVTPAGPLLLGGWSFGGVAAFEMARQLAEGGRDVRLVALLDAWAPDGGDPAPPITDAELLRHYLRDLASSLGRGESWSDEPPAAVTEAEAVGWWLARGREAGLVRADLPEGQVRRMLEVYKSNLRALSAYRPLRHPGAGLPIVLIRPALLSAALRLGPDLGWGALNGGRVEVLAVEGDHYSMLAQPRVREVARQLDGALEAALSLGSRGREVETLR